MADTTDEKFLDSVNREAPPPEPKRPKWKCRGCGYAAEGKWTGFCPKCFGPWNVIVNRKDVDPNRASLVNTADVKPRPHIATGLAEFDRVVGGREDPGVVEGSTYLIGGNRGAGKTTLLLQVADGFTRAKGGGKVLYVSGEETRDDIVDMAVRLGIANKDLDVIGNEIDIFKITEEASDRKAKLLIVDSVQVMHANDVKADVGQVAQIDAVTNWLTSFGKEEKVIVFLISHLNKFGDYGGSEKMQHLVDVLFRIDARPVLNESKSVIEGTEKFRTLSIAGKNRRGPEDVEERLEMTAKGLQSISLLARAKISRLGG